MENAPLNSPYTKLDLTVEAMSILVVLFMTGLILIKFGQLPNTIPTHYDINGSADAWGSKSSVIVIWVVAIFLYAGLTILNKYPQLFNFPVAITEENKLIQYKLATRLVRFLKFSVSVIFMLIMLSSFRAPNHYQDLLLGRYFIFIVLGLTFTPILYYFILARRNK